ncbi:MAG: hypothetical protein J2P30_00580, partial [Actinobacteria bacterium]|nr:hypothetical protein [Actinomycetota bacterium]
MSYYPRHALVRAVRSLSTATKVAIATVATGGLLGAGAVAAISASAATAPSCTSQVTASGPFSEHVTKATVDYYLGARNTITAGSAAILKPAQNSHTLFFHCDQNISNGNGGSVPAVSFLIRSANGTVYALTSRSATAGANVTLERPGNGHLGYRSQKWTWTFDATTNTYQFKNASTGLFLRVRNSGPKMGQTVSTGKTATDWAQSS